MHEIDYQLKKADDFISQGKFLHAIQIYQSIISANQHYTLAYIQLADLYNQIDKPDSAINIITKYLSDFPDDKEVRLYLGQLFLKNSSWNEAIDVLSLIVPEEYPIAFFLMGFAFYNLKDLEIAKSNFKSFLKKDKNSEFRQQAFIFLARIDLDLNNFDDALIYAHKAEEIYASNWEVNLILGMYYYKKGMYLHSINEIQKALKLNPDELSLHNWAGKAYFKMGDYLNAEKNFLECISGEEATSETYSYLGLACLNANRKSDATNYFNKALDIDPSNEIALEGIRKCNL